MRVLITGATGAIGAGVAETLIARGDEVVGLSREPERATAAQPRVAWHQWEPETERPPPAALEGVDGVVNLIGENINQRLTDAAKQRIRDSRVRATKNLVDAIVAAPERPKALVSQSAVGYYGDHGDRRVDESTPVDETQFLSRMVAEWEQAAEAAAEGGVRVAILRTAPILDPASGLLKQLLAPFRLGVGGPLAGGRWYQPWIHRDDEGAMLIWALDDDSVSGPINAAAPEAVTNAEFSKALGRVLGRPAMIPAPKLALIVLRGPELTEHITASTRVEPKRALELGYSFSHPRIEEALGDLLKG